MRRQITGMLLAVGFLSCLLAPLAAAPVNVNINIGPPPPVVVHSAPTMLFLADPGVYVAVGVPYDIFFIGGRYYSMHGSAWYWGSSHSGPWVHVVHRSLPPGLQKFKVHQLREFREREYVVYKAQGPNFKGKHVQAAGGGNGKDHAGDNGKHSAKPGKRGKK